MTIKNLVQDTKEFTGSFFKEVMLPFTPLIFLCATGFVLSGGYNHARIANKVNKIYEPQIEMIEKRYESKIDSLKRTYDFQRDSLKELYLQEKEDILHKEIGLYEKMHFEEGLTPDVKAFR